MELSLDPSELERLDPDSMAARYEQTLREQQNNDGKEDFSDMVAEHAAKQKVRSIQFNSNSDLLLNFFSLSFIFGSTDEKEATAAAD